VPDRLLLLLLVGLLIVGAWLVLRAWRRWRVARLGESPLLAEFAPIGRPAVIAFSSPSCVDCRSRQAPALARLAREAGDGITVRTVSALDHPSLVERIGILTVPATVVVDAGGRLRHLNLGFTPADRLHEQVRSASVR
jgi:thiol-disulfide isomerase/thioredoxin